MLHVPPHIQTLQPYQRAVTRGQRARAWGDASVVELASNENPLGPSPFAVEEMQRFFASLHRYPNGGEDLREALAARHGVDVGRVICGSGSEGIMLNIFRAFMREGDEALTSEGTFIGFYVLARTHGVRLVMAPLIHYHIDLQGIAERITSRTRLIYLANPNNPTGTIFSQTELAEFLTRVPAEVLVIVDEAYFEYARDNAAYPSSMQLPYENLVTLRTFSKAYGLAAARIGYGFGDSTLVRLLLKVKLPFEPSGLAEAAGLGALRDEEFLAKTLAVNTTGRNTLQSGLKRLGLAVVPTEANFVCVPFADEATAIRVHELLLQRGIIVRHLRAFGIPHALRIAVGTQEENALLLLGIQTILEECAEVARTLV